jgi:Uma2 family endonuclease
MTTAIAETVSDQVVCFPGTWNLYCELLENQGDSAGLRISFDGEVVQIMSPNYPHDAYAEFISRLIYEVCREWGVRMASAGTTTLKGAPDGGDQPDKSYRLLPRKDPALDSPADLVVEVDVTTPATQQINRLKLYAALGVREFWRYRHRVKTFEAFILVEDAYQPIETSVILPGLPIDAVRQQILHADILGDDWETIQSWHQWLQAHKP